MLNYEYNEDEVHELFYIDGKNSAFDIIRRISSGEAPEDIIASGVKREDVEQAVEALNLKV